MSEKFDMKLVIDAVTTPLLHEKLCQASSFRERAALLRSLAEAALRGSHVSAEPVRQVATRDDDLPAPERHAVQPAAVSQPMPPVRVKEEPTSEVDELRPGNENAVSSAHDVDQIADAFGSFF